MEVNKIYQGDALKTLKTFPDESVNMCMTSPPYWTLRDYGVEKQLGLESTFEKHINKMCNVFDEVKRVLRKDGTCWVNYGDTYGSSGNEKSKWAGDGKLSKAYMGRGRTDEVPAKSLTMIPFRFAMEMVNRGWILRNVIIWHKPNCMPSSAKDRFTVDFEYLFFFSKDKKYWFEQQFEEAVWDLDGTGTIKRKNRAKKHLKSYPKGRRGGIRSVRKTYPKGKHKDGQQSPKFVRSDGTRNKRTVWKITTKGFPEAHFAVYPEKLVETPIKAGCSPKGIVLDPFIGSGTTAVVARKLGRNYVGIELSKEYIKIAEKRLQQQRLL